MQHALRQPYRRVQKRGLSSRDYPQPTKVKKARKSVNRAQIVFQIAMLIAFVLASIALIRVVQYALYNQYALGNEQLRQRIAAQEQANQELASRKLSLESPQRIETIAMNRLKMIRPANVRYIVFNEPKRTSAVAFAQK